MRTNLENRLEIRSKRGNLRKLCIANSSVDFSSNDYLGLARNPLLAFSALQEHNRHLRELNGLGSTGSRLLTGNLSYAQALEEKIAAFHGFPAGLLFSCGYMANVGLLSAIGGQESFILFDAEVHASVRDGIRLSRTEAFPFRHNDLEHLEKRLRACRSKKDIFISIESIYSTDGSIAPLVEISQLARQYSAYLIVDEAHAVGACGPKGCGLAAEHNLMDNIFALVATFGKALGTYGAIVLGGTMLKEALINFATPFIYTTALPFQILSAISCSYDVFPGMDQERKHLQELIQIYRGCFPNASQSHIQSIPIKGNEQVKLAAQALSKHGFDVRPLMSPTVRQGHEALRVCLHAHNNQKELLQLCRVFINRRRGYYA